MCIGSVGEVCNGGLQSLAEAIAGILVIYGAPKLGDALLGGGASRALGIGHVPLLSTAIGVATGSATGTAIGAVGALFKDAGAGEGGAATPGSGAATPNATITEVSSLGALPPPINAEWGLIE